jgi:RND family efflux transporter MFP subunit
MAVKFRGNAMLGDGMKALVVAAAAVGLAACGQENQYVAPPPPKVTVAVPVQAPYTRYLETTGNTAAINSADLVARVPGFVESVNYRDGDDVKKGTLLFTIEPESYKLKLDQSKAAQASAEASLKQAKPAFDRQADLLKSGSTTQAQYDTAMAAMVAAQSGVDQAKVNTQLAQINYDYTQVTAPFDGIVTARQVSVGQYVGGTATPTVLASIIQHDPIYVSFSISEQDVLRIRAEMQRRGLTPEDLRKVPIDVGLQSETGYPHVGTLDYAAPSVSQSTGTLAVRGIFSNHNKALLPGYFVRVRVPIGRVDKAIFVPEVAVGSDQSGRYVLVVNKDNVVEQRPVQVGATVDGKRVVESGLGPDDRVIVAGLLRAVPGQKVDPQTEPAVSR